MTETNAIQEAMLRMSSISRMPCHYDPVGEIFGDGPIHFLVEVANQLLLAWEDNETGMMVVNPITRFELGSLEEMGLEEAWTVLRLPNTAVESVHFREINNAELTDGYRRMIKPKIE